MKSTQLILPFTPISLNCYYLLCTAYYRGQSALFIFIINMSGRTDVFADDLARETARSADTQT